MAKIWLLGRLVRVISVERDLAASNTWLHEYKVLGFCIMCMKFPMKKSNFVCFFTRFCVAIHALMMNPS